MGRLSSLVNALTEGVKVNAAWSEEREGRAVWFKRRRMTGRAILTGANVFFRLARAPIRAVAQVEDWRGWEMESFALLHGSEGFGAFSEGTRTVGVQAVPGINLTRFLDGGSLTPPMAAAAGRELRRAHSLPSAYLGGGWSHGDAHAGNFIYEPEQERARLIDFELRHRPGLSTGERQRDDVLGFLLDMVGRIESERWEGCAAAFLEGYGPMELRSGAALQARGLAGWWLRVRTTFLPRPELRKRWDFLQRVA